MTEHAEQLWQLSLNDEVSFKKMFEYYYANLCIYAKRYISDLSTREDLVQDMFCNLWINRDKIDYLMPVSNYLMISVRNQCLNHIRKNSKQEFDYEIQIEKLPLYAEVDSHLYLLQELEDIYNKTLASLPEEYRIAFVMSRMEDRPTAEIAETLGVSVRTVERYRNKAIELLRTELKDYLPLLSLLWGIDF